MENINFRGLILSAILFFGSVEVLAYSLGYPITVETMIFAILSGIAFSFCIGLYKIINLLSQDNLLK